MFTSISTPTQFTLKYFNGMRKKERQYGTIIEYLGILVSKLVNIIIFIKAFNTVEN